MSVLRKEWSNEEIIQLGKDLNEAKIKVLVKHGFSPVEISRVMELPESTIRYILKNQSKNDEESE